MTNINDGRMTERYICFDVETPNRWNQRMSAIGITVVEDGAVAGEFFSLVNPEQPFDRFNEQLTGISAAAVRDAPTFGQLWPVIEPVMSSGILAAHNAAFDLSVLRKCLADYQIDWRSSAAYVCTVRIGRAELPGLRHGLNDLCGHYGIPLNHHQADSDSRACAEILRRYMAAGMDVRKYIRRYPLE